MVSGFIEALCKVLSQRLSFHVVIVILMTSAFSISESAQGAYFTCTKTIRWKGARAKGQAERVFGVPCGGQMVVAFNLESATAAMLKNQCSAVGAVVEQLQISVAPANGKTEVVNCVAPN